MNEKLDEPLLSLYKSIQSEIAYYRDSEWRITISYLLFSSTILGFLLNSTIKNLFSDEIRFILTLVQGGAIISSNYHLFLSHKYLGANRKLRTKLESLFGFHEEGKYYPGVTILPEEWKNNDKSNILFEYKAFIFPFVIVLFLFEIFVIYAIWHNA
jgi:hypothetical protein